VQRGEEFVPGSFRTLLMGKCEETTFFHIKLMSAMPGNVAKAERTVRLAD